MPERQSGLLSGDLLKCNEFRVYPLENKYVRTVRRESGMAQSYVKHAVAGTGELELTQLSTRWWRDSMLSPQWQDKINVGGV